MDARERLRRRVMRWRDAPRERPDVVPQPGPGEESVWDYPRPPRVEPVALRVRVELRGLCIADTGAALRVLETAGPPTFYLPAPDIDAQRLEPAPGVTLCEWKGEARYWSARVGGELVPEIAWSYPAPFPEYARLADHFSFFAGRVDACWVGDERATAQPGDFYGGWVTRGILGPFKGPPGTERW